MGEVQVVANEGVPISYILDIEPLGTMEDDEIVIHSLSNTRVLY